MFSFFLVSSTPVSCALYKVDVAKVMKKSGTIAKYVAASISVLYAYGAVKETVKSAKLILPVGEDFTVFRLLQFPFDVLIKLPLGACRAIKNYFISSCFGVSAYLLHRAGF